MPDWARARVIGGGPAGAAAALVLAREGFPVTVLEKTTGPHDKVCGDFLSGPAIAQLHALGVCPFALGAAAIGRVRLVAGARMAEAALPFPAAGLSRRGLDSALLAGAAAAGARVQRGIAVRCVSAEASEAVLLATGKHDLPGLARSGAKRGAMGFKAYVALAPDQRAALADAVELVLLPGGYAGLQAVEADRASVCLMLRGVPPVAPARLLDWLAECAPHLRRRLTGARAMSPRPLAVARVPYGHLRGDEAGFGALFRVGDQAAVIPSLAGDGVAIALRSGTLAAQAVLGGEEPKGYDRRLRRSLRLPIGAAMAVHGIALRVPAQSALVAACRFWPGLMRFTATLTRCYQPPACGPAGETRSPSLELASCRGVVR
ncbi:MAG TPA: FAD-dependent monooxygenase [Acetobacteraceae bacterium]|nr:FAD-dependent monooxygenase [Acetobacteraceae bacterium]